MIDLSFGLFLVLGVLVMMGLGSLNLKQRKAAKCPHCGRKLR